MTGEIVIKPIFIERSAGCCEALKMFYEWASRDASGN